MTQPAFGIGQRAQLLRTPHGNILWDCIALVDRATVEMIKAMGGLKSIAISHPHYYTTMVEWSQAFGGIPIHLHAADKKWIMRNDPAIALWQGETKELAAGRYADLRRRALSRRHSAALGGGRRRQGRAACRATSSRWCRTTSR